MKSRTLIGCALLSVVGSSGFGQPVLPGIAEAMQKQIDAKEIAGAVTLVTTKDKVVHLEATGFADLETKRPLKTDSLFFLASTTKPIAALAVLMLQDEGKLKLSDPISKYIPAAADLKTPSGQPAQITILQLLNHTSGLGEHSQADFATATLEGLTAKCLAAPMRYEPGERWMYTTSGFSVAGRIVEIVSGKTFDVFMQERLFDPLGMKSTTFYPTTAQSDLGSVVYVKDRASGALNPGGTPPRPSRKVQAPIPGAGLFSTAEDLGVLCRMLLNYGVLDGKRYLSEEAYKDFTTVTTGDLPTGFTRTKLDTVLGWGPGAYILRTPHAGASAHLSAGSFGHPGALGTHLIVDPVKGCGYVFLVQRPNLTDNFENAQVAAFLDAACAALEPVTRK
jgi:CubicO group peptidase (beta-lactamase class C family)